SFMIRKIVFAVIWPFDEIYEKKFGLNFLRAEGFEVKVLDLSLIMGVAHLGTGSKIKTSDVITPQNYDELSRSVKSLAKDAVFIDCVAGVSEINFNMARLFAILKRHDARYAVVAAGALPLAPPQAQRIKKLLFPLKAADFLFRKICGFLRKHRILFPLPEFVFGGSAETTLNFIKRYRLKHKTIISVNSLDYNLYLEFKKSNPAPSAENTCVFIDDGITNHRDNKLLGIKTVRAENYFPHLNRLFDTIERLIGLKVIIAAHPTAVYENNPFGGRPLVWFKTLELVAKSRLVVAHASTAVGFAVLFNKPILFARLEGMKISHLASYAGAMAQSMGLPIFDIDKGQPSDEEILSYERWPISGYEDYKYKYIKSRNAPELPVHEIMAKEFKRI
ncbi:MAG: hypothetical protein NTW04_03585, partial [Elusimicrobia bacterium]|nr:hypothetical protein [Elusimicrobiota bacterium]